MLPMFRYSCRVGRVLQQRSSALAGLPGPKHNPLFGVVDMLRAKDPHRLLGAWTNQFGPIVRLRVLFFHVSSPPLLAECHSGVWHPFFTIVYEQ